MNRIEFWILIALLGAFTFGIRMSFLALAGGRRPSAAFHGYLKFIPASVMAAISLPSLLFIHSGSFEFHHLDRLLAGFFALFVAYFTRSVWMTILFGMCALWMMKWLL